MKTIEEIKTILLRNKEELKEKFSVHEMALFGSYARGEPSRKSDVDILIEFHETPGLLKFIRLENYLSDLLGVKVELVTRGALKPFIGKRILKEAVRI